ncbi:MAG TPA: alpha/beta fold hydrolase [Caldilineaceae bacterium]|nr:alpha/beta fold hydrolase [Caldilineaceae bacterium]
MAFEYPRLSSPDGLGENGTAFFACVIIGSGFGGSVMAARLSEHFAPGELAVLERGKEYQPGDFPTNFAQAAAEIRSPMQPFGMYDVAFGSDMDSLVGNALGGTSNLYANVILEPFPEVFNTCMDPQNPSDSRCWPQEIHYDVLKPYFDKVRGVMGVEKYLDREDLANGITVQDPHLAGSPLHGAEKGVDPQTGRVLRDYRGRSVAERPALAKAQFLKDALAHIQDVHDGQTSHHFATNDPLAGALTPEAHATGPDDPAGEFVQQTWTQLRNGLYQEQFATRGDFSKAPIAVNITLVEDGELNAAGVPQWKCRLCGDCVTGCNIGAKNTMIMNYLPLAKRNGAVIYTQVEVTAMGPSDNADYRYRLEVLCREEYQGKIHSREVVVYTNLLVLSAGTFGTTKLLLQAQMRGDFAFSAQLGKRFSGNADAIAVSYNGRKRLNSIGYGLQETDWDVGPTITAMADFRRVPGRRHLIEDAAFPSALVHSSGRLFGTPNLWKGSRRIWTDVIKKELAEKVEGALNHSQVWLAMGHDTAGGELRLDRAGNLQLSWTGAGAQQVYDATRRTFAKLAQFVGANNVVNPRTQSNIFTRNKSTPITVHPLGGCCMADDIEHGVVDHAGRVYHPAGGVYPGLYISDGSICDTSVGANPSLTIAALAERMADQVIANDLDLLRDGTSLSLHEASRRNGEEIAADGGSRHNEEARGVGRPMSRLAGILVVLLLSLVLLHALFDSPSQTVLAGAIPGSALSATSQMSAVVPGLELRMLDVRAIKINAPGQMRVGILSPEAPKADILFIHGHADRLDNHGALFTHWRDAGFRVISFDLPSHGKSNILPIDLYTHEELAGLARLVDRATIEEMDRPLFLAAWSFGGLVATRIAQEPTWRAGFTRDIEALLLLTPAVTPYPFAGGDGISRVETLTNNPNAVLAAPPSPAAPAQNPIFAGRLLYEAWRAHNATLLTDLPILVLAADPEGDWYVYEEGVIAWAKAQQQADVALQLLQCPQAKHALDNEPYPIGPAVHQLTTSFFEQVLVDGTVDATDLNLHFPEGATCLFVE